MFLSRTEPRSIASQLILLFTIAAAFLLACGLAIFYLLVVRHAFEEDNAVLADKVFALRAVLKKGGPELLADHVRMTGGETAWKIRLIDTDGNIVAESPGMSGILPAAIFPAPKAGNWQFVPKNYEHDGNLFSLIATRAEVSGRPLILQLAQDRSTDEQFSREFGALIATLAALGLIASAAIGLLVTKRGLRPLAEMTSTVSRIGPAHLDERVVPERWPRELRPLAFAFDEMLDRLEDSFTRLSQFSADLAHELRTPIANIRGEAEVALTRPRGINEYREVVESTAAECERLSAIVDNLLFLARAEAADGQVRRTTFDGRAALEKMASYYRTIAEERKISIVCKGEGDVNAEPLLFDRAISNLLDNSLRYTGDGGTISLGITVNAKGAEVSVRDSGSGISAEHLPRVFDRFYRADPSRSSGGTGLGLALVKSIAELHGGAATIESEPGTGTKVTLSFPSSPSACPERAMPS
ncbi:MAG: heavy metal sensor histidine kinase [Verrucomicrobia bacterium]|nr:heavy metal sensor histidine kinase [Verrucomicrobiota bacterium]